MSITLMQDEHLFNTLASKGMTATEAELVRRLEARGLETAEEIEARLEKTYEAALEQSAFRADLIEEILALCKAAGSKRELVKRIQNAVENSYVEL